MGDARGERRRAAKLTLPVLCGYLFLGTAFGAMLAQQLPFDLTGIDFAMTALFIVICVERAMNRADRLPMAIGGACAAVSLLLLDPNRFLAPALAATAVLLLGMDTAVYMILIRM